MSVDLGDVRTGIAVCDRNEILASPVKVINEKNNKKLIDEIINTAKEKNAELIVVGNPVNMDGTRGERSQKCATIANKIEQKSSIQTMLWDERRTTISAHSTLNTVNIRGAKRKNIIDEVAAVIILEDYLKFRKNT